MNEKPRKGSSSSKNCKSVQSPKKPTDIVFLNYNLRNKLLTPNFIPIKRKIFFLEKQIKINQENDYNNILKIIKDQNQSSNWDITENPSEESKVIQA